MAKPDIPRKAVYRLSLYHRGLQRLSANLVSTVSSAALAKAAGVKPTQLRKDLAYLGHFGTRGLGYNVEALSEKLTDVLGTARLQPVVLAGAGNLGAALLGYGGGFYDRTLRDLRQRRKVLALGVAFDEQLLAEEVPHGPEDERIDWLLTDRRVCAFV